MLNDNIPPIDFVLKLSKRLESIRPSSLFASKDNHDCCSKVYFNTLSLNKQFIYNSIIAFTFELIGFLKNLATFYG